MRYLFTVILVFFLLFTASLQAQKMPAQKEKPHFVMILSTYTYECEWSTMLAKDIRNRLESQNPNVKVRITYAGVTGHNTFIVDRFSMQSAFANGRLNNKIRIPDVMVMIGDESWMIYRVMNRGIWSKIPTVLCGVHTEVLEDYSAFFSDNQLPDSSFIPLITTSDSLKLKAVIEPDNSTQTIGLAQKLSPDLCSLYYLSDGSYFDIYAGKKLKEAMLKSSISDVSFTEMHVTQKNEDSITSVLCNLSDGALICTNSVRIPPAVRVPVLTMRDMSYVGNTPTAGFFVPVSSYSQKASELVMSILKGEADFTVSPYTTVESDTVYTLNDVALVNASLTSQVKELNPVIYRNISPPFISRYLRVISISLLIFFVIVFVVLRIRYLRRYRWNLKSLFKRYKTLYDEYQLVYENMPIGLVLFDLHGNLLNRNSGTDTFFELITHSKPDTFCLFDGAILDGNVREALLREELVSKMVMLGECCFRVIVRMIPDEDTGNNTLLMIVLDNTDIEKERVAKEKIYNVLNFAMNKSALGVAEYNLLNNSGFATDAWYENLGLQSDVQDFSDVHKYLLPDDLLRIRYYLDQVRAGASDPFLYTVTLCLASGEFHSIRYFIQPLEYTPALGRVIVAELTFNVDEQVQREHELEKAMKKAQEADRLKNAFIVNMKEEIRSPLKEIISCSQELVETTDMAHKAELNERIEEANEKMLQLLNQIIEISKIEMNH